MRKRKIAIAMLVTTLALSTTACSSGRFKLTVGGKEIINVGDDETEETDDSTSSADNDSSDTTEADNTSEVMSPQEEAELSDNEREVEETESRQTLEVPFEPSEAREKSTASIYGAGLAVDFYSEEAVSLENIMNMPLEQMKLNMFMNDPSESGQYVILATMAIDLDGADYTDEQLLEELQKGSNSSLDSETVKVDPSSTEQLTGKDGSTWVYFHTTITEGGVEVPCDYYIGRKDGTARALMVMVDGVGNTEIPDWASKDSIAKGIQMTGKDLDEASVESNGETISEIDTSDLDGYLEGLTGGTTAEETKSNDEEVTAFSEDNYGYFTEEEYTFVYLDGMALGFDDEAARGLKYVQGNKITGYESRYFSNEDSATSADDVAVIGIQSIDEEASGMSGASLVDFIEVFFTDGYANSAFLTNAEWKLSEPYEASGQDESIWYCASLYRKDLEDGAFDIYATRGSGGKVYLVSVMYPGSFADTPSWASSGDIIWKSVVD